MGLAVAALVLPVLSGIVLLLISSLVAALAIAVGTVLVSSLLLAIDARRLGRIDLQGRYQGSEVMLFVGMCLVWIVGYPIAFFRRRLFGGPNLGIPSILVALFFVGAPLLQMVLVPPAIPACDSPDVVRGVAQAVRSTPWGVKAREIDGHREVGYDRAADRRQGQCVAHTDDGDLLVNYVVQWRDRDKGDLHVRAVPAEVPFCTSREVVQVLEKSIRESPWGAKTRSIDGHREVGYDRAAERRRGQCAVHADGGDTVVDYLVEWRDREKGQFKVRLAP
jgi:hypothetical protein